MNAQKPALWLYIVSCILTFIAAWVGTVDGLLVVKPIVIPAILVYYFSVNRGRPDFFCLAYFLASFIGDCMILLEIDHDLALVMVPYAAAYFFLLTRMVQDVWKAGRSVLGWSLAVFVFALLLLIGWAMSQFFSGEGREGLVLPIILFAGLLGFQGGLATYRLTASDHQSNFYMAMLALFNCVSDIFYVIFTLILSFRHYLAFDLALQLFSYYFVVRYFILRRI